MNLRIIGIAAFFVIFSSCSPDIPVEWHEPGAQWRGVVEGGIVVPGSPVTVNCCQPGNNCAKREIRVGPIGTTLRNYIANDDLKGFFEKENWQQEIPELIKRKDIVDLIIKLNPEAELLQNEEGTDDLVIYKEQTKEEAGKKEVLFAITYRQAPLPCDDAK